MNFQGPHTPRGVAHGGFALDHGSGDDKVLITRHRSREGRGIRSRLGTGGGELAVEIHIPEEVLTNEKRGADHLHPADLLAHQPFQGEVDEDAVEFRDRAQRLIGRGNLEVRHFHLLRSNIPSQCLGRQRSVFNIELNAEPHTRNPGHDVLKRHHAIPNADVTAIPVGAWASALLALGLIRLFLRASDFGRLKEFHQRMACGHSHAREMEFFNVLSLPHLGNLDRGFEGLGLEDRRGELGQCRQLGLDVLHENVVDVSVRHLLRADIQFGLRIEGLRILRQHIQQCRLDLQVFELELLPPRGSRSDHCGRCLNGNGEWRTDKSWPEPRRVLAETDGWLHQRQFLHEPFRIPLVRRDLQLPSRQLKEGGVDRACGLRREDTASVLDSQGLHVG